MKTHDPAVLGFGGQVAYWESISDANAYAIDGRARARSPSRRRSAGRRRATGERVHQRLGARSPSTKFITEQQRRGDQPVDHEQRRRRRRPLTLRATSPYATSGSGSELTGSTGGEERPHHAHHRAVRRRLHAPSGGGLNRSVTIAAGATATTKVVMGFIANEIPESADRVRGLPGRSTPDRRSPPTCGRTTSGGPTTSRTSTSPEPAIKKNIYYRWWLMRFNNLDANIPGQTTSSRPRSRARSATTTRSR